MINQITYLELHRIIAAPKYLKKFTRFYKIIKKKMYVPTWFIFTYHKNIFVFTLHIIVIN